MVEEILGNEISETRDAGRISAFIAGQRQAETLSATKIAAHCGKTRQAQENG
jgi:hypothetical protein